MRTREILKLAAGFRRFREKYFADSNARFAAGQTPKTLIIGCSDSRVDPALITSASPGELFIVRNVANLVPPHESSSVGRHGVSAAIEFAVSNLQVQNIIILGHRQCGGIRALMSDLPAAKDSFIGKWMEIAEPARQKVLKAIPSQDLESQCKACELESIVTSIENLKTFPFVREALDTRALNILGIYFDLEQGTLLEYNEQSHSFETLPIGKLPEFTTSSFALL